MLKKEWHKKAKGQKGENITEKFIRHHPWRQPLEIGKVTANRLKGNQIKGNYSSHAIPVG
nr:hypothetical protein [Bacillus sp. FJAT-27445]